MLKDSGSLYRTSSARYSSVSPYVWARSLHNVPMPAIDRYLSTRLASWLSPLSFERVRPSVLNNAFATSYDVNNRRRRRAVERGFILMSRGGCTVLSVATLIYKEDKLKREEGSRLRDSYILSPPNRCPSTSYQGRICQLEIT